jgi:DNA-binding NtrC family response regulator
MASIEGEAKKRVLLVDDDEDVLEMMKLLLESNGFEVVAVGGVSDALKRIATESFQVLITDLHMPNAGDGFTVISAMRHSQPAALTMLLSSFPDVKSAMEAIILEADEIVVKPVEVNRVAELVRERLLIQKPTTRPPKESVSAILRRCSGDVVKNWLARAKQARELNHLELEDSGTHRTPSQADTRPRLPSGQTRNQFAARFRCHRFRRGRPTWRATIRSRLHSRDAGA